MDYVWKSPWTSRNSVVNHKNNKIVREWKELEIMWKSEFEYFSPIEKIFVFVLFGQILKNMYILFNLDFFSLFDIFPQEKAKTKELFFTSQKQNGQIVFKADKINNLKKMLSEAYEYI